MAEKKSKLEKSAAVIEAERLRKVASDAKEKAKSEKDADVKAYEKAKSAADAAVAKANRERFVRVSNGRYKKASTAIGQLEAIANAKTYTFNGDDLRKITDALQTRLDALKEVYRRAASGEKGPTKAKVADLIS